MRKLWGWIVRRLKDLFYGPGNNTLDHGRCVAFGAFVLMLAATVQNIRIGAAIDLGPAGLGGGLAAVLAAVEIYLVRDRKARGGDA